jgi:UDPglucose 6-dehydrogenase
MNIRRIQIIGLGTVGEATAYLFNKLGYEVLGYDIETKKSHYAKILEVPTNADLTFICTPEKAVATVIEMLMDYKVEPPYVIRSTVKPGTTESLMKKYRIHLIHNPEFLREKHAFHDIMNPSRIIIGQCCDVHGKLLMKLYEPLGKPIYLVSPTISEIVKLTVNLLRINIITFWNVIHEICTSLNIDTKTVAELVDQVKTIGEYEGGNWGIKFFGRRFGGKCFPENLDQIIEFCMEHGLDTEYFEMIKKINQKYPP